MMRRFHLGSIATAVLLSACATTTSEYSAVVMSRQVTLEHFTYQEAMMLKGVVEGAPGWSVGTVQGGSNWFSMSVSGQASEADLVGVMLNALTARGYDQGHFQIVISPDGSILLDKIIQG